MQDLNQRFLQTISFYSKNISGLVQYNVQQNNKFD